MRSAACLVGLVGAMMAGADGTQEGGTDKHVNLYVNNYTSISKMYFAAEKWRDSDSSTKITAALFLLAHLSDTEKRGITEHGDVYIPCRFSTGESSPPTFHGMTVHQDLYIKGGRAAWALEIVMDRQLPALQEGLSPDEYARRVVSICKSVDEWCNALRANPPKK